MAKLSRIRRLPTIKRAFSNRTIISSHIVLPHPPRSSSSKPKSTLAAMQQQEGYAWDKWEPAALEAMKRVSPAAERNKDPILQELQQLLPQEGLVLEVASGTGQHVAHFAAALPSLQWQPSDVTDEGFGSIRAYTVQQHNVLPPVVLDASLPPEQWPCKGPCAAVIAANVTHISPWAVTLGLVAGAGKLLQQGGLLFIYGPFKIDGKFTSDSNESFHHTLRGQNPAWGYRDAADVAAAAEEAGFKQQACLPMPANNFALVFRKE